MNDFNQKSVLLDTSSSKIQTPHKSINFTAYENLDFDLKKRNKKAFRIYLDERLPKISYNLIRKLYCDDQGIEITDFQQDFVFPLKIYEKYDNLMDREQNESLLYFAEQTFLDWYQYNKKKSKYILMVNEEKKLLKKLTNRFNRKYQKKVQNRMNWLMYKYGNENACSVTLTLNPGYFRNNKLCMWETINILLNEFTTQLRKWFKDRGRSMPKYIRCIESMKGIKETNFVGRGNPHIHLCFFGVKYIPKKVITDFWPYGFNFINSTAKNKKVRYPIHYITKYITKTYTENDPDNTLNQSLVWFFSKHSFDHSLNLVYPLYKKGSGEWNFEYFITMDPLDNDILEMELIFQVEENLLKIPPPPIELLLK